MSENKGRKALEKRVRWLAAFVDMREKDGFPCHFERAEIAALQFVFEALGWMEELDE